MKKIIQILVFSTLVFVTTKLFAYNDINNEVDSFVKKEFLIAKSTTSYKEAKRYAQSLAKRLNIKLDLRGLRFHKKNFLTFSKQECEENTYYYPCYISRGRYDDGEYISIEHSNSYNEFRNGYYIVVVASGNDVSKSLRKIQRKLRDAYVKKASVYMGCLH